MKKMLSILAILAFFGLQTFAVSIRDANGYMYSSNGYGSSPSSMYKKSEPVANQVSIPGGVMPDAYTYNKNNQSTSVKSPNSSVSSSAKTNTASSSSVVPSSSATDAVSSTSAIPNPSVSVAGAKSSYSAGGPLDSLAMSVLKAAEKHDEDASAKYQMKMIEAGAEGFAAPQIIAKRTPQCPPIKIEVNGKKMSGSVCGMFGYLYKGKQYDVGYCK